MIISMIAAVARNYVIGNGTTLPWEMPADMRYFMATTCGHHVIMGRKSFEDIGKPLGDRTNIIITRQAGYSVEGAFVVNSLESALQIASERGEAEAFIIGGEQIFTEGLGKAHRIYITWIGTEADGDTHFPQWNPHEWREAKREDHSPDAENPFSYSFTVLERA